MGKIVYTVLGWCAVGLGVIGIVLPVLPTTPFMILAAFLFAKGSPRARAWLLAHQTFGPHIENWESQGAITPKAKRLSVVVMGLVFLVSVLFRAPWYVLAIQAICMVPGAWFVLSRPDPDNRS